MVAAAAAATLQRQAAQAGSRATQGRLDLTETRVAQRLQVPAPVTTPSGCDGVVQADCVAVDNRSHPGPGDRGWSRMGPALARTVRRALQGLKRGAVRTEKPRTAGGERVLPVTIPGSNRGHLPRASSDLWKSKLKIRSPLCLMQRGVQFELYGPPLAVEDRRDVAL